MTKKLTTILKETRQWAENVAEEFNFNDRLMGLCAIVSKELFTRLTLHNYLCKIACNRRHCFVIYKNKIIDLTATQFGKPEIYITAIKNTREKWKIEKVFNKASQLTNFQKKVQWPKHQISLQEEE